MLEKIWPPLSYTQQEVNMVRIEPWPRTPDVSANVSAVLLVLNVREMEPSVNAFCETCNKLPSRSI